MKKKEKRKTLFVVVFVLFFLWIFGVFSNEDFCFSNEDFCFPFKFLFFLILPLINSILELVFDLFWKHGIDESSGTYL